MQMTRTSPAADRQARESGFSLFELLVVLSIFAVMTSFTAILFVNAFPEREIRQTVAEIEDDLRAARLYVRRSGQDAHLLLDSSGYAIPELGVQSAWPDGVSVSWHADAAIGDAAQTRIFLPAGRLAWPEMDLLIVSDDFRYQIRQEAITGRVTLSREARDER